MVIICDCATCKYSVLSGNRIMNTPCYKCKWGSEYKPNIEIYNSYTTSTTPVDGASIILFNTKELKYGKYN